MSKHLKIWTDLIEIEIVAETSDLFFITNCLWIKS